MSHHTNPRGVGLAYRTCLHQQTMQHADDIDLLEIPTEDWIVRRRRLYSDPDGRLIREATARFPCLAHGISMSIGSVEPLDENYMRGTEQFLAEHGIEQFSEHLAFHRMDGVDLSVFLCMPFIEDSLQWLARKYAAARRRLGRPFALENVSYYFPVPHCPMSEAEFLTRLTELTDCTLLLDVTNIYNNSENHGYDAVEFVRSLPGERISQLHLAGGHYADGMWQDSHSAPVMPGVWDLLDEVLRYTAAEVIVLERDSNFTPFERAVMPDIYKAREIFRRHRPADAVPHAAAAAAEADELAAADADADEFAGLRNFQRATMREITDEAFRRRVRADRAAAAEFPMDDAWRQRWADSDRRRIDQLAEKWTWIDRDRKKDDVRYAAWEWQAWVRSGLPSTPPSEK